MSTPNEPTDEQLDASTPNPGPQPSPPRSADDPLGVTEDAADGTGAGNPLEGVLIDARDAEQAVAGDEGPESPSGR
ncbi:hypothetical protein [Kineococcus gypseus]|uniref:hypothetical protein n=1 Tax=Kineococcus gypseus TaxID=1637102 RepID=UPI003D7D456B